MTRHTPPDAATLLDLVEAQVAATPDAPAVRFGDATTTYAELDRAASGLARRLAALGAGPERLVAVALPRSADLVVSLVAVLRTGAAYLPVDPDYPADRIAYMLSDAAPAVAIATRPLEGVAWLPPHPGPAAPAGPDAEAGPGPDGRSPAPAGPGMRADRRNPAYVIYTSGSTGRPKGAVVTNEAIVNRLRWMQAEYGLTAGDRVLQKTPSGFDVSVWEFFWPLITGATLVVAEPGGHRDPAYLAALIQRERVTTVHFVPSMLRAFLDEPAAARCSTLRRVICSGEALPADLAARFHRVLGDRLHNLYGPTEAAVDVTFWHCRPGAEGPVPIGRPVWNTAVHVLDRDLRPAAPGELGELYIGGVQLARGYLGRPGLTAGRFTPDPYGPPGARMYRTGDLARRRADGVVEFAGRADDQLKIRGFRVEPGEIEAVLATAPGVRRAAVTAREPRPGTLRLTAYVVLDAPGRDHALDAPRGRGEDGLRLRDEGVAARLREYAAARLPEYMVPSAFVVLDGLPLTPNGKLDRAALPEPRVGAGTAEPATSAEETLAALFAEVLGLPAAGAEDDFFALGGDSILALDLVGRARRAGLPITARQVLELGTVRRLAAAGTEPGTGRAPATAGTEPGTVRALAAGTEQGAGRSLTPGAGPGQAAEDPADALGDVPATPIMHWLRERGGPSGGFSQSATFRLPYAVDAARLAAALRAVLAHHDLLRARATGTGLTVPPPAPAGQAVPLLRVADAAQARAWERLAPEDGVMVRAVWVDPGPGRRGLLRLVVHHLVVDGVSWRVLAGDLARAYAGTGPLTRSTSFRTWARALPKVDRRAELPHWRGVLEAAAASSWAAPPGGREQPGHASWALDPRRDTAATTGRLTTTLPPERTVPLLTDTAEKLLTALAVALAAWRGVAGGVAGGGVLLDVEGHGREDIVPGADLSRTVGWFTSMYPVLLDPGAVEWDEFAAGGPVAGRALDAVAAQVRAVPGKGVGFGLLRHLDPVAGPVLAGLPRPGVCFNYLGRFAAGDGDWSMVVEPGAFVDAADPDLPVAHALTVDALVRETADGPYLDVTWSWAAALLDEHDIRDLSARLSDALAGLAARTRATAAPLVPLDQDELDEFEEMYS
ncbi:hypothetical protein Misp01_80690 [Microtetraspora sp. NBRC 13810]|uniref:amino acid adenylation domain-containing protein n=1 Tax=Microtetraspora sp. NBRC 13810 TaxID=3030990 RepID=UPI0024A5F2A4|nr:amino acid adenylation domain-containing protein [Microtetraspora sp. NBRC 13810]GLW12941.1 hypothetical protein Misp01_80690 [Microtetraspora sp. NBRC 13810]